MVPSKDTPTTPPKSATPSGAAPTSSTGKAPAVATPAKTAAALLRLLELGSDSCRPCQMMQPVLAALRTDYADKLQVDFIDVWKDTAAGDKYGVQAIPTQIFFDASKKEVFRHTGYFPKDAILAKFKEYGISL
jgi:thioredoxin 1